MSAITDDALDHAVPVDMGSPVHTRMIADPRQEHMLVFDYDRRND